MSHARRAPASFLIVFIDLAGFQGQSQRVEDAEIADLLDSFYERVASAVQSAGGTLVKFIGDAALAVCPESSADAAVRMLLVPRPSIGRFLSERGWDCRLTAKAHFGTAIAGNFGPAGSERFDVIGRNVNAAAVLDSIGITL